MTPEEQAKGAAIKNAERYGHAVGEWRPSTAHDNEWFADCMILGCNVLVAVRMWEDPRYILFTPKQNEYDCPVSAPPRRPR